MKKISIIVPVYNVEKYIGGCIESILSQSYGNWELLLLDDESSDRSVEICEKYAINDERIRVFYNKHAGVSVMRNKGIEFAKGEYITFVDSDDSLEPEFLMTAIEICENNNIEVFLAGRKDYIENTEKTEVIIKNVLYGKSYDISENNLIELLKQGYLSSCCGNMYLKDTIGETYFEIERTFGEDLKFVFDIFRKNVIYYADNHAFYNYHRHSHSLISKINIDKCCGIVETYNYLFGVNSDFNLCGRRYMEFVQERCFIDVYDTKNAILEERTSLYKKYKMLKVLFGDQSILWIFYSRTKGNRLLRKIKYFPSIILLKYYLKK